MVREAAAEQLEERQADWAYSRPVVALDFLWNLAFILVSAVVLVLCHDESPSGTGEQWRCRNGNTSTELITRPCRTVIEFGSYKPVRIIGLRFRISKHGQRQMKQGTPEPRDTATFGLMNRINDLGLLMGNIARAAGRTGPDFSRKFKFDAYPHLEMLIHESQKLFHAKQTLNRQEGLKAIEMKQFLPKKKKTTAAMEKKEKLFLVLQSPLADPEGAEQFKQFLKSEKLALFHEYLRLISQMKDPDFSGMNKADRAALADSLRQEAFLEASRLEEGDPARRRLEARTRIIDFDPKQGGVYYNSYWLEDLSTFDLGEESPIGPMRFTNKVFQDNEARVCKAVNILSVQVACSDVGFPIQVYGTVIARDDTDYKRIYLFRCDRDHCQLISSEDEPLILTGPKRGLALLDGNYVETDLKIRDHQGQDRELSKGVLTIRGTIGCPLKKCMVDTVLLSTRISTMKIVYAIVVSAVEATIAVEVVEGEFCGTVTAHTTSIKKRMLLYDGQVSGHKHADDGPVKMMRPVICVSLKDQLIFTAKARGLKYAVLTVTPKLSRGHRGEFTLGTAKMRLQVDWSIMDP